MWFPLILLFIILLFSVNITEDYQDFCQDKCEGEIPINSATCNNPPNMAPGLKPKVIIVPKPEKSLDNLAPISGKYEFRIPELKYDGIYSLKKNCKWSLCPNKSDTYATNNYFHVPNKSLLGKVIVEPPECMGYKCYNPPSFYKKCI